MTMMNSILAVSTVWTWILGSIVIVLAIALAIVIALQSGKDKNLSGAIAGGAETFFGKSKSTTRDKLLARLTVVISVIFVIVAAVLTVVVANTTF